MSESPLTIPYPLRMWMDKVEQFCNQVDTYLTEVEHRLKEMESGQTCNCNPNIPHSEHGVLHELPGA